VSARAGEASSAAVSAKDEIRMSRCLALSLAK
jgi:hypothetical protein